MTKEERQMKKRDMILNGNILKAILVISLPIVFYNICNYLYGIYDMMIVQIAHIGDAADVVFRPNQKHDSDSRWCYSNRWWYINC